MSDLPLQRLVKTIGHSFSNPALLTVALTHRSHGGQHNERLEFLGDALLNLVIAEALFERFPREPEGALTRMRSSLVKGETLALIAAQLGLGDCLRLGSGELKSGGFRRDSILADAVEAIIAAIYLDAGMEACRGRILAWFGERLAAVTPAQQKDAKTRLQELLQARGEPLPQYDVVQVSGKAHQQIFTVRCSISLWPQPAEATDNSRRAAEQQAASMLLAHLGNP